MIQIPVEAALDQIRRVRKVANEQALDEALWCKPHYASETYIQQALRRLTAAVEGDWEEVDKLDPGD